LEGQWALLGATEGGLALSRVLTALGGREALPDLDSAALRAATQESDGSMVTVEIDESTSVTVAGIGDGVRPGDVWLAALGAITDQIQTINQAMTSVVGPHRNMVATGGWSRSAALMQVKQRAFGELMRSEVEEAGARGAALLAGLAAGTYNGTDEFPLPGVTRDLR
jgi:sugar (pentulose or hexulose) kinase